MAGLFDNDWTIMVYMAGDNNLSENMAFSLNDLREAHKHFKASLQTDINLMAFFDGNSLTAPTCYFDFSDKENTVHEITKEDLYFPRDDSDDSSADNDGSNSASAYSIMNFVHWCVNKKEKKATNYALIFSGHSFGFHGTSFLRDESSGGFITLFKFRWALEEIINKCLDGKKISILGFDSCVMSMLEVGYELKDVAKTLVASEGSLPNSGWSYVPILSTFISNYNRLTIEGETLNLPAGTNSDTAIEEYFASDAYIKDMSKEFVGSFISRHNELLIGGRSIDIAALDLTKVQNLAKAVNNLGIELNKKLKLKDKVQDESLTGEEIAIFYEMRKIVLQAHYDTQTYMHEQCIDIKDFCKRLFLECEIFERSTCKSLLEIKKACVDIVKEVNACVLNSGFSGDEYQYSNGISLYFPWSYVTFGMTNKRYRYLDFSKGPLRKADLEAKEAFEETSEILKGIGRDWYDFLVNYLTRVSIRLGRKRKNAETKKFEINDIEDFSKSNQIWGAADALLDAKSPYWTKSNPTASKSNPTASKSNPTASKSNPTASKSNPTASKGEIGEYLFYFSRFKNFEQQWDISGFADEFKSDLEIDG